MSHKESLVTVALLGTEQQDCPPLVASGLLGDCFEALSTRVQGLGNARMILHAAALLSIFEKSGMKFSKFEGTIADPCEIEDLPYLSATASAHLRILFETQEALMPEWLSLVIECGKIVSDDNIIRLLQLGVEIVDYRPQITVCCGKKGRWLGQFNPAWSYVFGKPAVTEADIPQLEQAWELGDAETRFDALSKIRLVDPLFGLELLSSTWKVDTAEDRRNFILTFHKGLSMADEDFLETEALDDKRKEVRQIALDLLRKLPDSRWTKRSKNRAVECLDFSFVEQKKNFLTAVLANKKPAVLFNVIPPADCDKAMQRDGVQIKSSDARLGEKGWWLKELISQCNPRAILDVYHIDEMQLIAAFATSEWRLPLRLGLEAAICNFQDVAFAKTLLMTEGSYENAPMLFAHLDNLAREEVLSYMAERDGFLLIKQTGAHWDSDLQKYLMIMRFPWSVDFSKCILRCVRTHMVQKNNYIFMEHIMRHIGTYMNLDAWAEVKDSWATSSKYDTSLETMMWILSFRQEMKDALKA